jgi:hypothetical protein
VNIAWLPQTALPLAVSVAARWVRRQECAAFRQGVPLSAGQLADARLAGVSRPEHIRLLRVDSVAKFEHALLKPIALVTMPLVAQTAGLTARYGILIRSDCWGDRALLAHEFAHVAQYERLGGIRPFLKAYLQECHKHGCPFGALEQEAAGIAGKICAS